jgi:hypothetical protein
VAGSRQFGIRFLMEPPRGELADRADVPRAILGLLGNGKHLAFNLARSTQKYKVFNVPQDIRRITGRPDALQFGAGYKEGTRFVKNFNFAGTEGAPLVLADSKSPEQATNL